MTTGGITAIDTPVKPHPVSTGTPLGTNLSIQFVAAASTPIEASTTTTTAPAATVHITSGLTPKMTLDR